MIISLIQGKEKGARNSFSNYCNFQCGQGKASGVSTGEFDSEIVAIFIGMEDHYTGSDGAIFRPEACVRLALFHRRRQEV